MTTFSANGKDPERAKSTSAKLGEQHGEDAYPEASSTGEPAHDYVHDAQEAEAHTAEVANLAGHMAGDRPADDERLATQTTNAALQTNLAANNRGEYTETLYEVRSLESRKPLAARDKPWPPLVRYGLILVMAIGGSINLVAAILAVTNDNATYVEAYAIAVGAGLIALGATVGHMLRRWELNSLSHDKYVGKHWIPIYVVVLGLIFFLGITVSLAAIRSTASQADAVNTANSNAPITVFIPGQTAKATQPAKPAPTPTIPAWTWGLLEGVLASAAMLIEYSNYLPWHQLKVDLDKRLAGALAQWQASLGALAAALAGVLAAWDARADHDAGVLLSGEATRIYAGTETAVYRYSNLANRDGIGGDPFQDLRKASGNKASASTPNAHAIDNSIWGEVTSRWGDDLKSLGAIALDTEEHNVDLDHLVQRVLAKGLIELEHQPERPDYTRVTWDPSLLADIELPHSPQPPASTGGSGSTPKSTPPTRANGPGHVDLTAHTNGSGTKATQ